MPRYQVMINGENFLVEMGDRVAKHGFFTWRCVEAADPAAAELDAVQMIRDDASIRPLVRNGADDRPLMAALEIVPVGPPDEVEDLPPGLIWYEEKPRRWWQFWRR